jgi:hypothetical protein
LSVDKEFKLPSEGDTSTHGNLGNYHNLSQEKNKRDLKGITGLRLEAKNMVLEGTTTTTTTNASSKDIPRFSSDPLGSKSQLIFPSTPMSLAFDNPPTLHMDRLFSRSRLCPLVTKRRGESKIEGTKLRQRCFLLKTILAGKGLHRWSRF